MNRLPRVLITPATALAFVICARAQAPAPHVAPESEARLRFEGLLREVEYSTPLKARPR